MLTRIFNYDRLQFGILCFDATTRKITTEQVVAASQSLAPALGGCAPALSGNGERKRLVLCKEKTLRDTVRVIVITDTCTRANFIAKNAQKNPENVGIEPKDKASKTWTFITFPCVQGVLD